MAGQHPRPMLLISLMFVALFCVYSCLGISLRLPSSRALSWMKWKDILGSTKTSSIFERAMEDTFNSVDQSKTLSELRGLLLWLRESQEDMSKRVPELQSMAVQHVASLGIRLATERFNEATTVAGLEEISSRLTHLASNHGYPMTRRILVGAVLKMRAEIQRPFSEAIQNLIDKVFLQLFQLHRQSSSQKGMIQFFHISKSGGTNLCLTAGRNKCNTESFDKWNCLISEFDDLPRWVDFMGHKYVLYSMQQSAVNTPWFVNYAKPRAVDRDCTERAAYLKQKGWNFYANEFTLPRTERGICQQFVNLMIFRDPLTRLTSQVGWIQKLYKEFFNQTDDDISKAFKGRTSGFWERLIPAAANNYYIRSLLGMQYFDWPVATVNLTTTHMAMLEVLQYDLLMMLEQKEFNDVVLKVGLGWDQSLQDEMIRSSSSIKDEISMPVDYAKLIERNSPDVRVHQMAKQLQVLDVLLFKFIMLADSKAKVPGLTSERVQSCGYISSTTGGQGDAVQPSHAWNLGDANSTSRLGP